MRLFLAIRVFFLVLLRGETARRVSAALLSAPMPAPSGPAPAPQPVVKPAAKPAAPVRSEALNLLAAMQREARFVDFIQEPLTAYSDAQVGAAARQVHRDCGQLLDRLFGLQAVVDKEEGAEVEVPAGFDAGQFRVTGNVTGQAPYRGRLVHHGWQASQCQLPAWSGSPEASRIIAPAEVELK